MAIQKRRGKITSKFHNTKYRCDGLVHSLPGIPPAECAHDGTGKLQCPFLTRAHRVPSEACHAGPAFSLTSGIRQPLPTGSQTTAEPRLFHVLPKASDSIGPLCSCRALLLLPAWAIGEPLVKHRPLRCGISMPARHRNNRTSKKNVQAQPCGQFAGK